MRNEAEKMPNRHLATYALYLLGGDTKDVHTEEITLKCFELFPHSFSWVRYPKYPDKEITRIALCDARKTRYGALVEGRAGQTRRATGGRKREAVADGWRLTAEGIGWVKDNQKYFEQFLRSGEVKEHRQKILRELKRIKEEQLYQQYHASPETFCPEIGEIAAVLRCRVDAEEEIWEKRFETMRSKAQTAEQTEMGRFMELCREAYLRQR